MPAEVRGLCGRGGTQSSVLTAEVLHPGLSCQPLQCVLIMCAIKKTNWSKYLHIYVSVCGLSAVLATALWHVSQPDFYYFLVRTVLLWVWSIPPTRLVHRALEERVMMPQDASCLCEAMPEAGDSSVEVCRRKTVRDHVAGPLHLLWLHDLFPSNSYGHWSLMH